MSPVPQHRQMKGNCIVVIDEVQDPSRDNASKGRLEE